jgi:hypothetical protein
LGLLTGCSVMHTTTSTATPPGIRGGEERRESLMDHMSLQEKSHLHTAVERLVRDGCSKDEIEEVIARMTGRRYAPPSFSTRLRRLIGR